MMLNTLCHARVFLLLIILLTWAIGSEAQSGRRSTGGSNTTSPSVYGPKTVEKKPEKHPSIQLLVGVADPDAFTNIPYYLSDTVLDNCLRRLADATDVMTTSAGRGINRADAIRHAKEEKSRYVVWLQIGSDLTSASKQSKNGREQVYVNYTIFEPEPA